MSSVVVTDYLQAMDLFFGGFGFDLHVFHRRANCLTSKAWPVLRAGGSD